MHWNAKGLRFKKKKPDELFALVSVGENQPLNFVHSLYALERLMLQEMHRLYESSQTELQFSKLEYNDLLQGKAEHLRLAEKISDQSLLTLEDLSEMSYASKVVKESLSTASIVSWFPRLSL